MFGSDDRIQIGNTKVYPFTAIGYLESKDVKGNYESCSATLIGPSTVLTAAHCLYNHDAGGWQEDMFFVPGLNGSTADDAPFGGYEYDTAYVVQGFIDNYQGYYGSVLPWDLGIITLKQPIGENLGWLGYNNYDVARRFHRQHRRLPRRQAGRHDVALDLQRARREHRRRLLPVRLRHLSGVERQLRLRL